MVDVGSWNELEVVKSVSFGFYLEGGSFGEILLPTRYAPNPCRIGDRVRVFIYMDSEDRIIATTEKPYAVVGDFAVLKVVSASSAGTFLDWGLPKDLLAPFGEQSTPMRQGSSYLVRIYLDSRTNRIVASSKLDHFLDRDPPEYEAGQEVDLLVAQQTNIGFKAIINSSHWGVIHHNEVFQKLKMGQRISGFIKKVRDDGKIDLCLHKPGYEKVVDLSETIIDVLKEQGGFIAVTDKTSPEVIYNWFGVSKKTYKKAIGAIYKRRLITIEEGGIRLNKSGA